MVWYESVNSSRTTTSAMEQSRRRRVPQKESTIKALTYRKWMNKSTEPFQFFFVWCEGQNGLEWMAHLVLPCRPLPIELACLAMDQCQWSPTTLMDLGQSRHDLAPVELISPTSALRDEETTASNWINPVRLILRNQFDPHLLGIFPMGANPIHFNPQPNTTKFGSNPSQPTTTLNPNTRLVFF